MLSGARRYGWMFEVSVMNKLRFRSAPKTAHPTYAPPVPGLR
jgi:hypothetical protein